MTSVSVSEVREYPSLETLLASSTEFSIIPLCTIVSLPSSLL